MVPASGVAFFGPLQFQAGRACYAAALGRSYFGRASAPRALGPSIMQPAWTVPALPGLAMPSGACARSSRGRWSWSASAGTAGPSAAARGQPAPDHLTRGRGRVPWASCARRGQLPPRLPGPGLRAAWAVAGAASAGASSRRGSAHRPPRFSPRFPARIFPRNPRHRIFPRITRGPGASPRNASAINPRITKINYGSTKISFNFFSGNWRQLKYFAVFCKNLAKIPFIFRISRIIFKLRTASRSTAGQANPPRRRKKSAAPFLERRSFQFGHSLFNLVMRRPK